MRVDPVPDDIVRFTNTHSAVANAYSDRIDGLGRVDLLEPQTGMIRIISEEPVCFSGLALDLNR
jgi:hypothetical protein